MAQVLIKQLFSRWSFWGETAVLLLITPFFLFPTVSTTATILALLLLLVTWLIPPLLKRRPFLPSTPFNITLLLWLFMLIVSIGVTADPDLTLPKATGLLLGFALWRYIVWYVQDEHLLRWGIIGFLLLSFGFILFGILGTGWADKVPLLTPILSKLPSTFIHLPESQSSGVSANQLAGTIEIPLLLILSVLIGWQPRQYLIATKIGIFLLFVGLAGIMILTQSRSGWIGGVSGIFALLFLWGTVLQRSKKRITIRIAFILPIIFLLFGAIQIGSEKIQNIWEDPAQETAVGNLGTIGFRKEVWQWAIAGVQDFPFTGMGLGTFRQVAKRLYPLNVSPTYDIAHAHNIFLQISLDVGLPGLIAYLALLITAVFAGWKVARQNERLRPVALGLLAGLAALHIYGLSDALALGSKPGLLFWATLGLLTAMHQIITNNPDKLVLQ